MAPRVVLDTNCLVSALIFSKGRIAELRQIWQTEGIIPVVCRETVTELIRVLSYPKFKLEPQEIESLLAEFLPWAETFPLEIPLEEVSELRDRDDAVFINLAKAANAAFLVSGDKHLLELRHIFPELQITTPAELLRHISKHN